jgi:hypothetical protein
MISQPASSFSRLLQLRNCSSLRMRSQKLGVVVRKFVWSKEFAVGFMSNLFSTHCANASRGRVADGTRTRNNQDHNLGLYH